MARRRYRTKPVASPRADDDWLFYESVAAGRTIEVFDSEEDWAETGILDADGEPIQRLVQEGMLPIGFLADHGDDDGEDDEAED